MNKGEIKKEIYKSPLVIKQQVILEQVIAAGSSQKSSDGGIRQEWIDEELNADSDIII